jgi:hypothetical protein
MQAVLERIRKAVQRDKESTRNIVRERLANEIDTQLTEEQKTKLE